VRTWNVNRHGGGSGGGGGGGAARRGLPLPLRRCWNWS